VPVCDKLAYENVAQQIDELVRPDAYHFTLFERIQEKDRRKRVNAYGRAINEQCIRVEELRKQHHPNGPEEDAQPFEGPDARLNILASEI